MNEELKEKANEMLLKLLTGMEQAGDFAMAELPEVIEQLILYKAVYHTSIFLFCLVALPIVVYKTYKLQIEYDEVPVFPFGISFAMILIIGICVNFDDMIMVCFAPKLYLLEYARGLVG